MVSLPRTGSGDDLAARSGDSLAQTRSVLFREHFLRRYLPEFRVSYFLVEVPEGELLGLGLEVYPFCARSSESADIKAFEDVEYLQSCDALAGRRYLVDPDAPVVGVYRLYP